MGVNSRPGPPADPAAVRQVLPVVFAVTLAGITVTSLISPAVPEIARDLGLGDFQAGLILAGASMPGIVLAPVVGVLADRLGRKRVLVTCLVIFGTAGGLGAFAANFAQLFPLRVVQGVGAAGLINLSVVIIGDMFTGAERARWIGINAVVLTIGLSLNPQIGGLLASGGHWRRAFLPYWLALVVAALAARRLREPARPATVTVGAYLGGVLRYARKPRALGVFASGTVVFVLIFGVILFLFVFKLDQQFDLSPAWIGVYLGVGALVTAGFAALAGRFHARYAPGALVAAGFFCLALGFVIMAFAGSLVAMAIAVPFYAAGEGLSIPTMQNLATDLAPDEYRGALVAVWVGSARLGQTLGPMLAGVSLAAVGSAAAILFSAGIAVLWGVVLVVGLAGRTRRGS